MDARALAVTDDARLPIAGTEIHYRRLGVGLFGPPLVFLHEGLGSIERWREFPREVVTSSQRPGLVYSRHGNGWSSPLTAPRQPGYMHIEALETLPRLVEELLDEAPILIGHSDGASIAIIYAGAGHPVEGLVLIAPHVFAEPETLRSIRALRDDFPGSEMEARMAQYHADPETTFYGWADVWLSPPFRSWNIEEYLSGIDSPTLVVQGDEDEYGTTRQLDAIDAGLVTPAERVMVTGAGHAPHISHPDVVTSAVTDFVHRHS